MNNLCSRYKVIDSLNDAKMAKYSLVITPTPCRVAGCMLISQNFGKGAPMVGDINGVRQGVSELLQAVYIQNP